MTGPVVARWIIGIIGLIMFIMGATNGMSLGWLVPCLLLMEGGLFIPDIVEWVLSIP